MLDFVIDFDRMLVVEILRQATASF